MSFVELLFRWSVVVCFAEEKTRSEHTEDACAGSKSRATFQRVG